MDQRSKAGLRAYGQCSMQSEVSKEITFELHQCLKCFNRCLDNTTNPTVQLFKPNDGRSFAVSQVNHGSKCEWKVKHWKSWVKVSLQISSGLVNSSFFFLRQHDLHQHIKIYQNIITVSHVIWSFINVYHNLLEGIVCVPPVLELGGSLWYVASWELQYLDFFCHKRSHVKVIFRATWSQ